MRCLPNKFAIRFLRCRFRPSAGCPPGDNTATKIIIIIILSGATGDGTGVSVSRKKQRFRASSLSSCLTSPWQPPPNASTLHTHVGVKQQYSEYDSELGIIVVLLYFFFLSTAGAHTYGHHNYFDTGIYYDNIIRVYMFIILYRRWPILRANPKFGSHDIQSVHILLINS